MIDREKVIQGLEFTKAMITFNPSTGEDIEPENLNEANKTTYDACVGAIAMLKEQKHGETFTVIDTKAGKEADEYEIALHEDWAKHLCYCDMEGWAIEDDGTLLLVDECGRFAYADRERFKVKWE